MRHRRYSKPINWWFIIHWSLDKDDPLSLGVPWRTPSPLNKYLKPFIVMCLFIGVMLHCKSFVLHKYVLEKRWCITALLFFLFLNVSIVWIAQVLHGCLFWVIFNYMYIWQPGKDLLQKVIEFIGLFWYWMFNYCISHILPLTNPNPSNHTTSYNPMGSSPVKLCSVPSFPESSYVGFIHPLPIF